MENNPADENHEMEGVEVTTKTPLLTEQEIRLLEVYGRLEALQLEIALLKAQGVLSQGKFDKSDHCVHTNNC